MIGQLKGQPKAEACERMNRPAQTRAFQQRCDDCKSKHSLGELAGRFSTVSGRSGSDGASGNADSLFDSGDRLPGESCLGHSISRIPVMASDGAVRGASLPQMPPTFLKGYSPLIQAKLAISEPGDALEQEADRIADKVMTMPLSTIPQVRAPLTQLQRSSARAVSSPVPSVVGEVLRSPGAPLDAATRAFMEPRFGHDFSLVRVHSDLKAAQSSEAVNALAYTVGQDIFFEKDRYAPHSQQGKSLLAHELVHTLQQRSAPGGKPYASTPIRIQCSPGPDEFKSGQIVSLKLPILRMATEPGGNKIAALLKKGDLLQLGEAYRYGGGKVFYATVTSSIDQKYIGKVGVVRSEWVSHIVGEKVPIEPEQPSGPIEPEQPSGSSSSVPPLLPCNPKPIDLTKIPKVMGSKGWTNGAALLREWFSNPASGGVPDTTTITMNWVLGYSKAKEVYNSIFSERIYINRAAQVEILKVLKRKTVDKGGSFDFSTPLPALDYDYINFKPVPSAGFMDSFDDLVAALGAFVFHVVVGGKVEDTGANNGQDRYKASIIDVGVYVRDSFDFNGDQPLGCWNVCTDEVGKIFCGGGEHVSNSDFREWRSRSSKGGDFKVYSDVKTTKLNSPEFFFLPK